MDRPRAGVLAYSRMLDASLIWRPNSRRGGLYMGGFPHDPSDIAARDFGLLVICAREVLDALGEPSEEETADTYGCATLHAPFDDDELTPEVDGLALRAADVVASVLRRGDKALVTCNQGRNRSGLVAGLALLRLRPDLSGPQVVNMIKTRRAAPCGQAALTNDDFRERLARWPLAGWRRKSS